MFDKYFNKVPVSNNSVGLSCTNTSTKKKYPDPISIQVNLSDVWILSHLMDTCHIPLNFITQPNHVKCGDDDNKNKVLF